MSSPFLPSVRKDAEQDARLADPGKPGGASDYNDPNPVDAEHVLNMMRSNFPEPAIEWVKRARWTGPVNIPWERIDTHDIDRWAATHQQDAVNRFARDIKAGTGHTNPSILIQDNNSPKAIVIDGHHRALAHHKLGQDVLGYLGNIDPKDRQAAEETHASQFHSGADPRNKDEVINELLEKFDDYWYRREIGHPMQRREVYKILTQLRDAGRSEYLLSLQAQDFGWSLEQIDNPILRAWLCGD